jgi:OHCU decarboxylase
VRRLSIEQLNDADQDAFVGAIGFAFEGSPWIAAQAWHDRPFSGLDQLYEALCAVVQRAPRDRQLALIEAHPDLVGRAALAGTLTPHSQEEQASAGLDRLSPDEVATFARLNAAYRERFGFPFVICVRENKTEAILAGLTTRLGHARDQEIATALGEIAKIARLRLLDVLTVD